MTTPETPAPGPAGAVVTGPDDRPRLVFRRELPHPVEDVWSALTDPERCARWFARWTGDGRPGGIVEIHMTSDEDGGGPPSQARVVVCAAPHRLTVEIAEGDGVPWELTATLTAGGRGTLLEFTQLLTDGFSAADAGPGWHWYLDRLAASLSGAPMPDWEQTLAATTPHYG